MTKIFFTTDVHGSEKCFRKFLNAGKVYKTDLAILGGDFTGKSIIPIIEKNDGSLKANFAGEDFKFGNRDEAKTLVQKIVDRGYYSYFTNESELEQINTNPAKKDQLFFQLMKETLERWIALAEQHLMNTGIKCYVMPGNDDNLDLDSVFESSKYVVNPEGRVIQLDEYHEMISTGFSNITPWNCPRDIPEEKLTEKIDTMASQVKNMKNCIFNFHCPPYDSDLDTAPKLVDMKPVAQGGEFVMEPVGSKAVRSAIEKYQPLMGLHGHIHESRGTSKIGRTLCLNAGSEYSTGVLRGLYINLQKGEIKGHMFTAG